MLHTILMIIGIIFALFIVLVVYSCCVVSGRNSRIEEELEAKDKYDILSGLERETVEKLKKEFTTMFEANRNIDITVGECLNKFEDGKEAIISNGFVLGFTL